MCEDKCGYLIDTVIDDSEQGLLVSLIFSLSLYHTHTHTHIKRLAIYASIIFMLLVHDTSINTKTSINKM